MTAIRLTYLQCDTEDCDGSTSDECFTGTADARAAARELGWRRRNGKDVCPACVAGRGPYSHGDEHLTDDELSDRLAARRAPHAQGEI